MTIGWMSCHVARSRMPAHCCLKENVDELFDRVCPAFCPADWLHIGLRQGCESLVCEMILVAPSIFIGNLNRNMRTLQICWPGLKPSVPWSLLCGPVREGRETKDGTDKKDMTEYEELSRTEE